MYLIKGIVASSNVFCLIDKKKEKRKRKKGINK